MNASTSLVEPTTDRQLLYPRIHEALSAILSGERNFLANMANTSSLLFHSLPDLNWAGFYLFKKDQLVLGPFQGKPACVRIAVGKGVCGTAAQRRETLVIPDVHAFPEHIACDDASRSEIVVPIIHNDRLIGVMDLDSPIVERFNEIDAKGLEEVARILLNNSDV